MIPNADVSLQHDFGDVIRTCGRDAAERSIIHAPLDHSRFEVLASDADRAGVGISVAVRPFARAPDLRLRAGIMDGYGTGPFDHPSAGVTRRQEIA
jgi:hypothetical protein